jgi:outer membrane protein TolC
MFKQKRLPVIAACLAGVILMSGMMTGFAAAVVAKTPQEITVDEAVRLALANNPSGKIAVFEFEAAKGALTSARSYRWFTISAQHKDSWTWNGEAYNKKYGYEPNFVVDSFTNGASLNWTLWSGNKIESQVSQAKLSLDSSQWGIAKARQQLKYDATDAYFKFMAARDNVKLSQESVERLERYLRDVKLQFDVGVVAKVDVLRSEVSLAQARQTLIEAQNTYDLTMANLNNIIGLPLTTELSIKGDMGYARYEKELAACVDAALRQRPEISQYTDSAKIAQEGITIAKSGYLPTVSAVYNAGWSNDQFPGGNNYNWSVYLLTSWTLFDSGLTAGKVKQAVEGYKKAQEQLKQTVDSVQLDVRSTYLSLKSSEQSIATSSSAVGLAEEDYKIKVIRYQAGVGTNLDVLDAQVALTTAKNNYLKALYDFNNYRAKLDKAMGISVN